MLFRSSLWESFKRATTGIVGEMAATATQPVTKSILESLGVQNVPTYQEAMLQLTGLGGAEVPPAPGESKPGVVARGAKATGKFVAQTTGGIMDFLTSPT